MSSPMFATRRPDAEAASGGIRAPVQARSRRVLEKVLASAEHVLSTQGFDDFTIAAVAEHAGVSIGGIYRRFEAKEQLIAAVKDRLLTRLEQDLSERLHDAGPDLAGVVEAFTHSLADAFASGSRVFPDLIRNPRRSEMVERGQLALVVFNDLFQQAAAPHLDEVRRHDPVAALHVVERAITGAMVHRAVLDDPEDGLTWEEYADQLSDMALTYLSTPERPRS